MSSEVLFARALSLIGFAVVAVGSVKITGTWPAKGVAIVAVTAGVTVGRRVLFLTLALAGQVVAVSS